MYAHRPPEERIDRYAGPYERWVMSEELGRPFAFPAVRLPDAHHFAAILEGPADSLALAGADIRLPPLWPPGARNHEVTPFVFRDDGPDETPPDRRLAKRLRRMADGGIRPRVRVNLPVNAASWVTDYAPGQAATAWRKPARRPRAILGVIDDGLPFAHRAFLDSAGHTRISHLWLQSARAKARDRVPVGREIANGEIDTLRGQFGADERRLYRSIGAIDDTLPEIGWLLSHHATHGGHILGLAGGNDPRIAGPVLGDDVQIIAVQLPNTVAWDTSGFGKEMFMLSALHYIFNRASEIARAFGRDQEIPLVVNFSYGWSAGRHDGDSEMELAIRELIGRRRQSHSQVATTVVMPTGNTFAREMHARIPAGAMGQGAVRLGWRLHPDDRTSSYLEIWLPQGFDPSGWQVRVTPPSGSRLDAGASIDISPDPAFDQSGDPRRYVEMESDGKNLGQLSVDKHRGTRWRVLIAVIPTAETGQGRRLASGLWQIEIDPGQGRRLAPDQALELWLQRDDDPVLMRMGGRQSRIEAAPDLVSGFGSLSAICGSPNATRVAGHIGRSERPAAYSSGGGLAWEGATLSALGAQPSFSAASDQDISRPGIPSIGCVSGSGARIVGTSAAAALASRWMVSNAAEGRTPEAGLIALSQLPNGDATLRRSARLGRGRVPIEP